MAVKRYEHITKTDVTTEHRQNVYGKSMQSSRKPMKNREHKKKDQNNFKSKLKGIQKQSMNITKMQVVRKSMMINRTPSDCQRQLIGSTIYQILQKMHETNEIQ